MSHSWVVKDVLMSLKEGELSVVWSCECCAATWEMTSDYEGVEAMLAAPEDEGEGDCLDGVGAGR